MRPRAEGRCGGEGALTAARAALRSKLKVLARRKCDPLVAQYVECTKEHTFTVFWQCKAAMAAVNACMNELTNEAAQASAKRQWVAAGRPSDYEWMPNMAAEEGGGTDGGERTTKGWWRRR